MLNVLNLDILFYGKQTIMKIDHFHWSSHPYYSHTGDPFNKRVRGHMSVKDCPHVQVARRAAVLPRCSSSTPSAYLADASNNFHTCQSTWTHQWINDRKTPAHLENIAFISKILVTDKNSYTTDRITFNISTVSIVHSPKFYRNISFIWYIHVYFQ